MIAGMLFLVVLHAVIGWNLWRELLAHRAAIAVLLARVPERELDDSEVRRRAAEDPDFISKCRAEAEGLAPHRADLMNEIVMLRARVALRKKQLSPW